MIRAPLYRYFAREFRKRKKKTALITFAITWGTLSILLLMSFGRGLSNSFRISFKGLGDNLIMIYRGQTYLGDLKIDTVRPKEAGGKLTLVKTGQQVQRGDRVVYGY